MSRLSPVQDPKLLHSTAEQYRRGGYQVIEQPEPSALPFDLGSYQPDLIARKGDQGLVVSVRPLAERISFDRLRTVAEEVKQHEGWQFVLVTGQDSAADILSGEDEASWQENERRADEARRLSDLGQMEAAYLMYWIAFEGMMRLQARRVALPVDRVTPSIMIPQLYSQGELSMSQYDTALECQKVRNRIVHGFRAADLQDSVSRLSELVREVREEWSEPVSA